MPKQTDNRLRWERVPVLGKNPVFCFEARRVWTRRTFGLLVLVVVAGLLLTWQATPVLGRALARWGPSGLPLALLRFLGSPVPPAIAPPKGLTALGPPTGVPLPWHPWGPYVLLMFVEWVVRIASVFLVAPLTAVSLANDRASGRLEALLASQLTAREVIAGKLMAVALPLILLLVGAAGVFTAWATKSPVLQAHDCVVPVALTILRLMATAMIGLRVGASARQPAAALAVSLLLVILALPTAFCAVAFLASWAVNRGFSLLGASLEPAWVGGLELLVYGAILVALWVSSKRAIERAAE